MSEILSGLEGFVCMADDVLVHGRTQEEHGQHLDAALARISNAGVTLNAEMCELSQGRVKFLATSWMDLASNLTRRRCKQFR